jgi:hypothetical protein
MLPGNEHITRVREITNANKVLIRNPERKRPHGRLKGKWEDNIKMNPKETGLELRGSG